MREYENAYRKVIMPKVYEAIQELKREVDPAWAKERRLSYLKSELSTVMAEIKRLEERHMSAPPFEQESMLDSYSGLKKTKNKLEAQINILLMKKKEKDDISPELILLARDYPITDLIEAKRGMANCVFHDDKRPSMSLKFNRYHCFSCGAKGDVIDFIQHRDGLNFTDAVRFLAGVTS